MGTINAIKPDARTYNKNILILTEDSGSGKDFYIQLIQSMYPWLTFSIDSTSGYGGIEKALNNNMTCEIDACIVIIDIGVNKSSMNSITRQLRNYKLHNIELAHKVIVFSPECFEQVLLSFTELNTAIGEPFDEKCIYAFNKLRDIITKGSSGYNYYTDKIKSEFKCTTKERAYEKVIEKITEKTSYNQYRYIHGDKAKGIRQHMEECWVRDCCYRDKIEACNTLTIPDGIGSKLELIALESLAVGIVFIIDSIFGYKYNLYKIKNYIDGNNKIDDNWYTKYITILGG